MPADVSLCRGMTPYAYAVADDEDPRRRLLHRNRGRPGCNIQTLNLRSGRANQQASGKRMRYNQLTVFEHQLAVDPDHIDTDGPDERIEVVVAFGDPFRIEQNK